MTDDFFDVDTSDPTLIDQEFEQLAIDSLDNGRASTSPIALPSPLTSGARGKQHLFFDLETIPDEERMHLFDLEPIQEVPAEKAFDDLPPVEEVIKWSVEKLGEQLPAMNPCHQWLNALQEAETAATSGKGKGPRDGLKKAIKAVFAARDEAGRMAERQRKVLSTTPEFCKIVAVGWALGEEEVRGETIGHSDNEEKALLLCLWDFVAKAGPIVGFNVLGFDLPVLFVRSILLGVNPSRLINTSPWSNRDVVDLMPARFGRSVPQGFGLKRLAKLYGIPIPAGELDGSQVERLYQEDRPKLAEYVRSDVWVAREVFRKWSGFFCV